MSLLCRYKPSSVRLVVRDYMSEFFSLLGASPNHTLLRTGILELYASSQHAPLLTTIMDVSMRALRDTAEADVTRALWGALYARGRRIAEFTADGAAATATPFALVRGVVARAIAEGKWLLIDEVNMASVECLNAIASLLAESAASGESSNFRLFACMNPATDTGKRRLPHFIRSKFTEFFVDEPREAEQITSIVRLYMPSLRDPSSIAKFYLNVTQKFPKRFRLVDKLIVASRLRAVSLQLAQPVPQPHAHARQRL